MPDASPSLPDEPRDLVRRVARYVHTRQFNSHRLIDDIAVDGQTFTYVANSHLYADQPGLRQAEYALFREWASAQGVRVLAEETYPRAGDDAGYTSVLLRDLDPLVPPPMARNSAAYFGQPGSVGRLEGDGKRRLRGEPPHPEDRK